MTVHELIHTVSINDVREEICKIANIDASQQYEKLDSFLMKIQSKMPENSNWIITGEYRDETCLCEGVDVYTINPEEPETTYSIIDVPWVEVLGYQVNEDCFSEVSQVELLANIFWEMTWYGFDEEARNEKLMELEANEPAMTFNSFEEFQEYMDKFIGDLAE